MTETRRQRAVDLVCLDMAGTTVKDDGVVERAFTRALDQLGLTEEPERTAAVDFVRTTMGRSKIEVFRDLFGDEALAARANEAFEAAFGQLVEEGAVEPISGAAEVMALLRTHGVRVALTTGFAPVTRDGILEKLQWSGAADLALSPADAGRGRPYPDMIMTAAARFGVIDPVRIAVAGDTRADMQSGAAAGVRWVVGVLTGSDDRETLAGAGATDVIPTIAGLPVVLGFDGPL